MKDQDDIFTIKKLGSFFTKEKTSFRVFAPAYSFMYLVVDDKRYTMVREGEFFSYELSGDYECSHYHFIADNRISFTDPFAYAEDKKGSIILDKNKFIKEKVSIESCLDPIIYECSIRDFSADASYVGLHKKKFLAYTESGLSINGYSIGLDYLKELGVTHLQFLPVFAYDYDRTDYNWGYNPLAYNYVHRDYLADESDPYAFVNELRRVVNVLHKNDLHVTLDVVFNHVYSQRKNELGKMLAGKLFRYKSNGAYAGGTFCGNEVRSEDPFVRAYIIEMCERYVELFDIDGLRFDLMGILDYETINLISERMKQLKPDFMVYGEGWNMGDVLPIAERAAIVNADKMKDVLMFNDYCRETFIHYVCGNDIINEDVKSVLSCDNEYLKCTQSINYVECHDDYTFFDRMMMFMNKDPLSVNKKRCLLALSLVLIARGTPFIHAGEEFFRSKEGVRNSYNSGDRINSIKWNLRCKNAAAVSYIRDLIKVRRIYGCFRDKDVKISFAEYERCIIYKIGNLMIIINPSDEEYVYADGNTYMVIFADKGLLERTGDHIRVSAYSLVICEL